MRKFSPEERRGVVIVVAIALILCFTGLLVNRWNTSDGKDRIEVRTIIAHDSVSGDTVKVTEKSEQSNRTSSKKRKKGSPINSTRAKRRMPKKGVGNPVEPTKRDILSDTIKIKKK